MMAARRKNGKKSFRSWKGLLAVVVLMLTLASSKDTLAFMKAQTEAVTNIFDFKYYFALKYDLMGGNTDTQPVVQYLSSKDDSVTFDITHKENANRQMVPEKDGCFFLGWSEEPYGLIRENWADYASSLKSANETTIAQDIVISPEREDVKTSIIVSTDNAERNPEIEGYGFSKTIYAQWGAQLISGPKLNVAIKQLANPDETIVDVPIVDDPMADNATDEGVNFSDSNVEQIIFQRVTKDLDTYASELGLIGEGEQGIIVDESKEGSIKLYYKDGKAYILSQHQILANPDSSYTFHCFFSLNSIQFDNYNTCITTNMAAMFKDSALSALDLTNFDTSHVTAMNAMFANCYDLESIDWISDSSENSKKFNTRNVVNMSSMFSNCMKLLDIDLEKFNTEKVTNMSNMFNYCTELTDLNLLSFNTEKVTNMSSMFNTCKNIAVLDISSFNTQNVTNMKEMFSACRFLQTIYADEEQWTTDNVTDSTNMFFACINLSGKATGLSNFKFKSSFKDKTYACVYSKDRNGYLTDISEKPLDDVTVFLLNEEASSTIDEDRDSQLSNEEQDSEIVLDETPGEGELDNMNSDNLLPTESEDIPEQSDVKTDVPKEVAP